MLKVLLLHFSVFLTPEDGFYLDKNLLADLADRICCGTELIRLTSFDSGYSSLVFTIKL